MRYWIFWEELVQGPYTAEELAQHKAFAPELLICEENKQDWIPVSAAPDLARRRHSVPEPTLLPPSADSAPAGATPSENPPLSSPALPPLQGELFKEPAGQQKLFDPNSHDQFYYGPATEPLPAGRQGPPETPPVTMPFRFGVLESKIDGTAAPEPEPASLIPESSSKKRPPAYEIISSSTPEPTVRQRPLEGVPKEKNSSWLVWIGASLGLLLMIGSLFYWLTEHFSSRSAIAEAVHQAPRLSPVPGVPSSVPVSAKPVPTSVVMKPVPGIATVAHVLSSAQKQIIARVTRHRVSPRSTVDQIAHRLLTQGHDKELMNAADTGQRLYLPDKMEWNAWQNSDGTYDVQLNYWAWQASGQRNVKQAYVFHVAGKKVSAGDAMTRHDFFDAPPSVSHRKRLASDAQSLTSAVDWVRRLRTKTLTAHGVSAKEMKNSKAALRRAESKLKQSVRLFRSRYTDTKLQNMAAAYKFSSLLKEL